MFEKLDKCVCFFYKYPLLSSNVTSAIQLPPYIEEEKRSEKEMTSKCAL
jgi:hypothetical protein